MSNILPLQSPQFLPKLSNFANTTNPASAGQTNSANLSSMLPSNLFEALEVLSASPQQPTNPSVDSSQQVDLPDILSFIVNAITDILQGQENFNQQSVNTDTGNQKDDKKAEKKAGKKADNKAKKNVNKKDITEVDNKDMFAQNQNINNKNEIIGINSNSNSNSLITSGDSGINEVIAEIEKSPTGQILLNNARKRGVEIAFGDVPVSGAIGIFEENGSKSKITVKDTGSLFDNIETLTHELGHSLTREDGNSIEEEVKMEQLADKVTSEAGFSNSIESEESIKERVEDSYQDQGLPEDNGVSNTLEENGISL